MLSYLKIPLNYFGYNLSKNTLSRKYYQQKSDDPLFSFHPTPIANYYLPKNSKADIIAAHMKRGVFFEPEVIETAKQFIKKGTGVLDIGANFGQMSLAFSELAGAEGIVYSFEAQKSVFNVLQKNIDANHRKNIKAHYNAVYSEDNLELVFPDPDFSEIHTFGSFGLNPSVTNSGGQKVTSITVDSLRIETPISFMKIDIQGADLFALRGAKQTILKHKMPILFEFEQEFQEQFGTSFKEYVDFVDEIGYKFERTVLGINYLIVPG